MKKIYGFLLLVSFFSALNFSCSKDKGASSGSVHIKANFDGTEKIFNQLVLATKTDMIMGYNLAITAISGKETFTISLWSELDNFAAGQTFNVEALGGTTYNSCGYNSNVDDTDPENVWFSTTSQPAVTEKFTCVLTEVTASSVKGTFTADIYKNDGGVQKKVLTNGTFYAKF